MRLPPLKSLQAFDAAARHLSFKKAAEELCVTPTAISHQIKLLEDHLGVQLFHRLTRSLRLTPAGATYAPLIREGFDKLNAASLALNADAPEGQITVTTTTSFASNWLSPRLPRFKMRYPKLSMRLISTDALVDFARDGVDIAIRYGFGAYPGLHTAWVLDDFVAPVCSPSLPLDRKTPRCLLEAPLIHYEWSGYTDVDPSWAKWLRRIGITDVPLQEIATYSDEHMCLQAAMEGHGVALVSIIAAARDLEAGRLAAPFPMRLKNKSYYLVCPETHAKRAKVRAFQDWLLEEVDLFRDSETGRLFLDPETTTASFPGQDVLPASRNEQV